MKEELAKVCGQTPLLISSVAQQGLEPVLFAVFEHVKTRRDKEQTIRDNKIRQAAITRGEIEDIQGWQP